MCNVDNCWIEGLLGRRQGTGTLNFFLLSSIFYFCICKFGWLKLYLLFTFVSFDDMFGFALWVNA